ncbi:MAG: PLP-dependent transferase [Methylocella sp.]
MCHPATTVRSGLTEEARREIGITPALIRMSIGIEPPDDLVADMRKFDAGLRNQSGRAIFPLTREKAAQRPPLRGFVTALGS